MIPTIPKDIDMVANHQAAKYISPLDDRYLLQVSDGYKPSAFELWELIQFYNLDYTVRLNTFMNVL